MFNGMGSLFDIWEYFYAIYNMKRVKPYGSLN